MELRRRGLGRYGLLGITVMVFFGVFILCNYVRLYGDDFFYYAFTTEDIGYFVKRHVEHYQIANGRAIVHLLATLFLGIPKVYWSICNGLMLAGIVFFGGKLASHMEKGRGKALWGGIILAAAIGMLNPHMTRQSVYWLTGSFNYVYPIFMLMIYWYFLNKSFYRHQYKWYIPVLGFLAAATVEQGSLMTFGLTLLVCLDLTFMKKYKWNKWMTITLLMVTLGMCSVILAPSTFYRASLENSSNLSLLELVKGNIKTQGLQFLFTKYMAPFHILALGGAWGVIISLYKQAVKSLWLKIVLLVLCAVGSIGLIVHLILYPTVYPIRVTNSLHYLWYLWIGVGYLLTLFYGALLVYKHHWIRNHTLPLIALILGVGSQLMLIISPVYGPRNVLFAVFMFALYGAVTIPHSHRWGTIGIAGIIISLAIEVQWVALIAIIGYLLTWLLIKNERNKLGKLGVVISYGAIILIAAMHMLPVARGYRNMSRIYDANLALVEAYKENESSILKQYRLVGETYYWAMPYHNDYYDAYYKLYIGVDRDTKLVWY